MATVDPSNNNFYLSQLNIDMSAGLLTIPGGSDTTPIESNCDAALKCPVSFVRHLLQYQTDAIDVNDLNSEDIKFRTYHISDPSKNPLIDITDVTYFNARNLLIAEAITYNNAKTFYGSASATDDEKKVGADYARQVSEDMFGTTAGVDIFNNERAFRHNFLQESVTKFVERLDELAPIVALWNDDPSGDADLDYHPSKEAYKQMIKNFPERFANSNDADVADRVHAYDDSGNEILNVEDASGGTIPVWRYMPFLAGDKIYFQLTADPHSSQGTILETAEAIPVSSRSYRIRLDIVNDADLPESEPGSYFWPWSAIGPNYSFDPDYLLDDPADTDAPSAPPV